MKWISLFAILLTMSVSSYGQRIHLEPAKDFRAYEGVLKEYYDNVFPLLHSGFTEKPYARYTSMPSFSREYAFSAEKIGNAHYLIANSLSENYWYAKKRNKVRLLTRKTEIGSDLYLKLGELFQVLAEQTKEPKEKSWGLDGVMYYFSSVSESGGITTGEAWSPREGSLLALLVEICDAIHMIGVDKEVSQEDVSKRVEKLIMDLKQYGTESKVDS